MKKGLKIAGIGILALLIVVILMLNFFMGGAVKTTVNTVGPQVLGVPIRLEDADVRLLRGHVDIKGLVVGNPEGFKSDRMFKMNHLRINMEPRFLLTDRIRIREIIIDAPDITYEMSIGGSNIGTLMKLLAPDEADSQVKTEAASNKRVVIDHLVVSHAKIHLTSKLLRGKGVTIPLPTIELTDIGKEEETSIGGAVREVLVAVAGGVVQAVKSSGKLLGDGAKAVGNATTAGAGAVVHGAGAAGDAGGAVLGGGKAAAGAVAEGAGKLVSGVGGLFKGDAEPATDEDKDEDN